MNAKKVWFGYISFLVGWGICSYFTLATYLTDGVLFARTYEGRPYINDFVNTYCAAQLSRKCIEAPDLKPNIYDPKLQDSIVRTLIAPVVPEQPFYTQYPPYYFALTLPLAWLTIWQAWIVFAVGGLVAAFFSLKYASSCFREDATVVAVKELPLSTEGSMEDPAAGEDIVPVGKKSPSPADVKSWAAIALGLCTYPMWLSVELGQQALILFPCATAFWFLLQSSKNGLAGAVSGISAIKLQYAPALGLVGLLFAGWRFVLGGLAAMCVLLALAAAVVGMDNVVNYPHYLLSGESGAGVSGVNVDAMQNLRGQVCLMVGGADTPTVHYIAGAGYLISLILLASIWWRMRSFKVADEFRFTAATSMIIFIGFSLHTHIQDYVLASISCIWLWHYCEKKVQSGIKAAHLTYIRRTALLFPLASWLLFFLKLPLALLRIQPYFWWSIFLLIACLIELLRIRPGSSGEKVSG